MDRRSIGLLVLGSLILLALPRAGIGRDAPPGLPALRKALAVVERERPTTGRGHDFSVSASRHKATWILTFTENPPKPGAFITVYVDDDGKTTFIPGE